MSDPRTTSVTATIEQGDAGGFIAIASNGDLDRDNERIQPGCMLPLPKSIPVHLDHTMSARSLVARARPYYSGEQLMIDARFASTSDSQDVRRKVAEGVIDSISIMFRGLEWKEIDGVRTCVRGELLAADLVSVPSLPSARILSTRSYRGRSHPLVAEARRKALMALVEVELDDARRFLKAARRDDVARTRAEIRHFLRSL